VIKYELDGGFTESFVDNTPYPSIVCSAMVASGTDAGKRTCTVPAGCDADTDTPDATFEIAADGTFSIDLLAGGAGGCVADSTGFASTVYATATMKNVGNDLTGTWT
jgi:hypothetical protein